MNIHIKESVLYTSNGPGKAACLASFERKSRGNTTQYWQSA
jgi:hypothetical protein